MIEEWKDIPGFEGYYKCSNLGRIKSIPRKNSPNEKLLKPYDNGRALITGLSAHGKKLNGNVGTFVLITFVSPRPTSMECCHNDGNYKDNTLSNLRWDTHLENCRDFVKQGKSQQGSKNVNSKFTDADVLAIKAELAKPWHGIQKYHAEKYHTTQQTINSIARAKSWTHLNSVKD